MIFQSVISKSILVLALWLLAFHFENFCYSVDLTRYIAPAAVGDGSGSSQANAASYLNPAFWGGVQNSLSNDAVTVRWLDGQYNSDAGLTLTAMGNQFHQLSLIGNTDTGASIYAMSLEGSQNILIKDLNFITAPANASYALRISTNGYGTTPEDQWGANPSHNIVIDSVSFNNLTTTVYGAIGVHYNSYDVSIRNSTFNNVGIDTGTHMLYAAYGAHHISLYNNSFADSRGQYVRFRADSDYGVLLNNTFKATNTANTQPFVAVPQLNSVDPNNNPNNLQFENFGTHFIVGNNDFNYQTTSGTTSTSTQDQRTILTFNQTGYEPPGTNYLPSPADGAVLQGSDTAAKKALLKTGMGIDTDEVHYYNNTSNNIFRTAAYRVFNGGVSDGWIGSASITSTLNTTVPNSTPGSKRVDWKFGSGEGWANNSTTALQNIGWQFRSGTTGNSNQVAYVDTNKVIGGAAGVLFLNDSASSNALNADYKFQQLVNGRLEWRMGIGGIGSKFGLNQGHVDEGGLSLLGVELVDSHTLRIQNDPIATQDQNFSDVDFGSALDWLLDWTSDPDGVNGFASMKFKDASGVWRSVYSNRAYDHNIVPDTVWFNTSTDASDNFIFLDSMAVIAIPEPCTSFVSFLGLFSVLAIMSCSLKRLPSF